MALGVGMDQVVARLCVEHLHAQATASSLTHWSDTHTCAKECWSTCVWLHSTGASCVCGSTVPGHRVCGSRIGLAAHTLPCRPSTRARSSLSRSAPSAGAISDCCVAAAHQARCAGATFTSSMRCHCATARSRDAAVLATAATC
eukprot:691856-Prymnesium_polylepis.1